MHEMTIQEKLPIHAGAALYHFHYHSVRKVLTVLSRIVGLNYKRTSAYDVFFTADTCGKSI